MPPLPSPPPPAPEARGAWGHSRRFLSLRLAGDLALAPAALGLAFLARFHLPVPFTAARLPWDRLHFFAASWPAAVVVQLVALYFFGFYDPPRGRDRGELARRLAAALTVGGLALIAYFFLTNRAFPRSILLLFVVLDFVLVYAWRSLLDRASRRERRVAIVGSGEAAHEIAAAIARHRQELVVVGYVPVPGEPAAGTEPGAPGLDPGLDPVLGRLLGDVDSLPALLAAGIIDDIILAAPADSWQTRLIDRLADGRPDHANVLLLPGPFESLIGRMRYRSVHDVPLIEVVRESEWRINRPAKRLLDLILASVLAVASLPVLAVGALAVYVTSPGPVLYRQQRIGRGRRPFVLWKLRTMRVDAESDGAEVLAQQGDPRLTAVGALLRRARIDEIPQLWNVLAGSMSLVGPRPERPGFVQQYLKEVPGYAERFSLPPGLTGWAQVNGDYHSSPQNKLRYELAYMGNWSLGLDLAILIRTVRIVLTSRGV